MQQVRKYKYEIRATSGVKAYTEMELRIKFICDFFIPIIKRGCNMMKGRITYIRSSNTTIPYYSIFPQLNCEETSFILYIYMPERLELTKDDLEDQIKAYLKSTDTVPSNLKITLENAKSILDLCDEIELFSSKKEDYNLLKNKKSKIFIEEEFDITEKDLKRAQNIYENNPNVYIKTKGNDEKISLEDYQKTVKLISKIANRIKTYNLSPLEQLINANDVVRNRLYKKENEEESYTISRDLTAVLLGEKIVCVGYAKKLNAISKLCGQTISLFYIAKTEKIGHAYNIAYIQDKKYNLDGIYYFDATADRKIQENEGGFLNRYKYFCLTDKEVEEKYKYINASLYDVNIEKYINMLEHQELSEIKLNRGFVGEETRRILTNLINIHNLLLNTMDLKLIYSIEELQKYLSSTTSKATIEELQKYQTLINKTLPLDTFINALYNVRKIEYYEAPEKYEFSIDQMKNTVWNSDNDTRNYTNILDYFDSEETQNIILSAAIKDNMEKKIAQVKLTKVLQKVVAKK